MMVKSIQWGAWHRVGMVAGNETVLGRMVQSGLGTVAPALGMAALAAACGGLSFAQACPPRGQLNISLN